VAAPLIPIAMVVALAALALAVPHLLGLP